jgi:hypothetical protein
MNGMIRKMRLPLPRPAGEASAVMIVVRMLSNKHGLLKRNIDMGIGIRISSN